MTEVSDNRLKALYGYETVSKFKENKEALKKAAKGDVDLAVSIGIGRSSSKSESHSKITEAKGGMVQSGENVTVRTKEDLHIQGSDISGNNVTLEAGKDIHISAAEETMTEKTSQKKRGGSIGVNLSAGSVVSVTGSLYAGKEKEKSSITSYKESTVTASDTLTMKSGKDTSLIGSTADGNKVEAEIGGNLAVESLQTKKEYSGENKSAGISFGRASGKTSYSGSVSKGSMKSDYESVTNQAGIRAGNEGFAITVKDNTHLKGGVIDSKAEKEKNSLTTGTFSGEDVKNKADYKVTADGRSVGVSWSPKENVNGKKTGGLTGGTSPIKSQPVKGKGESTTRSAISVSTITITDKEHQKQKLSDLNRDTSHTLNQLEKIFDKEKVQERQELANEFAKLGAEKIGDIAREKGWAKNDPRRVILHGLLGGITAKLGGNRVLSGTMAGASVESLQPVLDKFMKNHPDMREETTAILGYATGKLFGGDRDSGAAAWSSTSLIGLAMNR